MDIIKPAYHPTETRPHPVPPIPPIPPIDEKGNVREQLLKIDTIKNLTKFIEIINKAIEEGHSEVNFPVTIPYPVQKMLREYKFEVKEIRTYDGWLMGTNVSWHNEGE